MKCKGCGSILQNENVNLEGYVTKLDSTLCERCFRIKNYGDYKKIEKDNNIYKYIKKYK